jgi:hypothetical protein
MAVMAVMSVMSVMVVMVMGVVQQIRWVVGYAPLCLSYPMPQIRELDQDDGAYLAMLNESIVPYNNLTGTIFDRHLAGRKIYNTLLRGRGYCSGDGGRQEGAGGRTARAEGRKKRPPQRRRRMKQRKRPRRQQTDEDASAYWDRLFKEGGGR